MDLLKSNSFITDIETYLQKVDELKLLRLDDMAITSIKFATFRANLFNIGLGDNCIEDLHLFNDYARNSLLQHVQFNTFLPLYYFTVKYKDDGVKKLYETCIQSSDTILFNSFHFGAFPLLMNYLILQDFDLICLSTPSMRNKHENCSQRITTYYNTVYHKEASLHFIDSEDLTCILQVKQVIKERKKRKNAIIIFTDIEENVEGGNKNYAWLFNQKFCFSHNVSHLAQYLHCPLINCLLEYRSSVGIQINIDNVFCSITHDTNAISQQLFADFESHLSRHTIAHWVNIYNLHHFINISSDPPFFAMDSENKYEPNRFTVITLNNDRYLFDSRYYVAHYIPYRITTNNLTSLFDKMNML